MWIKGVEELPQETTKWAELISACECPSCGDRRGHAGLFEGKESGYCVKCGEYFYFFSRIEFSSFQKAPSSSNKSLNKKKDPWEIKPRKVNLELLSRSLKRFADWMRLAVDRNGDKVREILRDKRHYSENFIDYLIGQNILYYTPLPRGIKPLSLAKGSLSLPFFEKRLRSDRDHKEYSMEYKQLPSVSEGLMIPLHEGHYMLGYDLRNMGEGAKYLKMSTDKGDLKYIPSCTYLDSNLAPLEKNSLTSPIYIVEGVMKAHAIHFYMKSRVIGVSGAQSYTSDDVKRILLSHRQRPIIVVPDMDYKNNYAVASATYKLIDWLTMLDCKIKILEWSHPDPSVQLSLKGVDDALIQNEMDGKVSWREFSKREFAIRMDRRYRQKLFEGNIQSSAVLDRELLETYDLVIRDERDVVAKPDLVYDAPKRLDIWSEVLASHKFVVDISPTGMGKSHTVGDIDIEHLSKTFIEKRLPKFSPPSLQIGLFEDKTKQIDKEARKARKELEDKERVKRVQYICQSPLNLTVPTLNDEDKWDTRKGRTQNGWTYDKKLAKYRPALIGEYVASNLESNCPQAEDIVELRRNRQVIQIKQEICEKCPKFHNSSCIYFQELAKVANSSYLKLSLQSLTYAKGDVLIIDDFGSVNPFVEVAVSEADMEQTFTLMETHREWKSEVGKVKEIISTIRRMLNFGHRGKQIADLLEETGEMSKYPIFSWLSKEEPDKIPTKVLRVRSEGGMESSDSKYIKFTKIKRWLFLFLSILIGKEGGDFFWDATRQSLVLKGIDPKFKDMLDTVSGILILDATANKEFLKSIFGRSPYVVSSEADPLANVTVTMVEGFGSTYKSSLDKRDGLIFKSKFAWINEQVKQNPSEKAGIITFKSLLEGENEGWLDPSIVKGYWFFSDRASNLYFDENCKKLYLVGVPIPNIASAFAEVDGDGKLVSVFVGRPYGKANSDGSYEKYIITRESDNPILRQHVWYKRASALIQALGRLRSVRRPDEQLELIILDPGPLPFPVDRIIQVDDITKRKPIDLSVREVNRKLSYLYHLIHIFDTIKEEGMSDLDFKAISRLMELGYKPENIMRYVPSSDIYSCRKVEDLRSLILDRIKEIKGSDDPDTILPKQTKSEYLPPYEIEGGGSVQFKVADLVDPNIMID